MKSVFADAGYWIALQNPDDDLHERAKAVSATLGPGLLVTSEMVLTEYLNYFAGRGDRLRGMAVAWVQRMEGMPNIDIVRQGLGAYRLCLFPDHGGAQHCGCAVPRQALRTSRVQGIAPRRLMRPAERAAAANRP
jgi:hypothetical protein